MACLRCAGKTEKEFDYFSLNNIQNQREKCFNKSRKVEVNEIKCMNKLSERNQISQVLKTIVDN